MRTADPDADLEVSLAEWRRYRRRKRVADIHWIDAMYQAYITALIATVAVYVLAGLVGDGRLGPDQLARVAADGDDWLGVLVAVALAVGLRSGSRGGPLAMERAEVRHVLLAPVDRTSAVRGPVLRQLRFLVFAGTVVGLAAGDLAARRLEHHAVKWVACGALFGAAVVALAYGAALCAAAWRLPSWAGTVLAVGVTALAVADVADLADASPFGAWGRVALWPDGFAWSGVVAVAVSLAVLGIGLLRVGDLSLEAADRRATLVGQLRFAATMQDIRTVLVLRRQLAMELPRLRPWVRLRVRGAGRFPVWARGWRGVLRWPAARVGRLVILAVTAGLSLRGVWEGTTPLLVVAGLALFLAGLDAVEPLAQEVDHPSRAQGVPRPRGDIHLRHLPVAVAVMLGVAGLGAAVAVLADPVDGAAALAAVCAVPAALGGVAGAVSSVLGAVATASSDDAWSLVPPEVAGMRLLVRTALPPALAVAGTLPVLAARAALDQDGSPLGAAATAGVLVVSGFVAVASWVATRDQLHAWWRASMEQAFPSGDSGRREEGDADAA